MRGLEAGLVTFLVYLILQVAIFHFIKISRRAVVLVGLWASLFPVYGLVYAGLPDDAGIWPPPLAAPSNTLTVLSGSLLYSFIVMGYIFFFYIAESSVGVRAMIELTSSPERGLTLEELTARYRYDWMLERRLRRMVHAGYLVEEEGWYRTTQRGHMAASVSAWVKRFLCLGLGG